MDVTDGRYLMRLATRAGAEVWGGRAAHQAVRGQSIVRAQGSEANESIADISGLLMCEVSEMSSTEVVGA
jgi:hypothetical protein